MNAANTQQIPSTITREPIDLDAMLDEANRAMQRVSAAGQDTRALKAHEKENILAGLAKALGLNPLSNPVRFLPMQGGEVLYVTRQGTDQIAARLRLNRETVVGPEVRDVGGTKLVFCQVRVTAPAPDGRSEMATATLPLKDISNDLMKCETKAKRRATLSLAGLGLLTEEETETIPGAGRGDTRPDALNAFRLDLADVTDCRSLTACWQSHAQALHAASDQDTARLDVAARMTALRYALTSAETTALLGGTMHPAYYTALDELTEIERGDLDEDGDAVIADVVRTLRAAGDAPSACKGHIGTAAIKRAVALGVADAKARITAALKPPQPPTKPTGTDAPTASAPASADGGSVAPSQSAGAQASASPRLVLDADEAEARYLRDDAIGAEAWASHLAACVGVFAMAGAHTKRAEAFRAAGVLAARRGATLAAIEAREGRGPEAALQALDGYRTRRVVPIGASVRARSHREQVAARTGTEG